MHPNTVIEGVRLGGILLDRGNLSEAELLLRRGLGQMRRIFPADYENLGDAKAGLDWLERAYDEQSP